METDKQKKLCFALVSRRLQIVNQKTDETTLTYLV